MKTFLFIVCLIGILSAEDCGVYKPVCAAKDGEYKTFPNKCEANAAGYAVQRKDSCVNKIQKIDPCTARCTSKISMVCGSASGKFKNYINDCWAKCEGAVVVSNNTCAEARELAFEFINKFANAARNAFKGAERWVENRTQVAVNSSRQVWHQIGEKWEECNCKPFKDLVKFVKTVVNDTERLANMTAAELQVIERNTIEGFYLFKAKSKAEWEEVRNATIEAAKRLENRTKEFFRKVGNLVKNVTEEASDWIIEEGQSLRNRSATWWHRTKEGIENCTCCLIEETEEEVSRIVEAAERAANKTRAKVQELKDRLKRQLIRWEDNGENLLERTKSWWESLYPCICRNFYDPVCVETAAGERASILNKCYADCKKGELRLVGNGTCEAIAEQAR